MVLPTVILPGYLAGAEEYLGLQTHLEQRGVPTLTVPLRKWDWVPTIGGRSMIPILRPLHETVQRALQEFGCDRINLICHSAGGWVARIYLGEKPYQIHQDKLGETGLWDRRAQVATLVTLGTPHTSRERWTLRNLNFVNDHYPGAFYPEIRYVCVAGKAVFGARRPGQWLAYSSYEITCGQGACWGDGITPIVSAHLEGAENVTLEGVRHAPRPGFVWYGSPDIVKLWIPYLA
ncbi:MAG: lipase [Leptolyngbyaceae cyanobacterium bins.59]|nr:lipase [Leptolyngbyaceae cyanobacterium bins.59]